MAPGLVKRYSPEWWIFKEHNSRRRDH